MRVITVLRILSILRAFSKDFLFVIVIYIYYLFHKLYSSFTIWF